MTKDKMRKDALDRLVYPPAIVGPNTVVLCPPVGDTRAYMKYLKDNEEHYRAFFGLESFDET